MYFLTELSERNNILFNFGMICLVGTLICIVLIYSTNTEVNGINAWLKPFKFWLSSLIFSWSMGWYMYHLPDQQIVNVFSWSVVAVLSFELIYICYKASIGEISHFNVSNTFNSIMWGLMGVSISLMTLFALYIGFLFFKNDFSLEPGYLWGIRIGIFIFVVFAFEGGIMGAKMSHTVGGMDGSPGIPMLNWSKVHGDLRIAHFFGMHALQVLPMLGFYVLTSARSIIIVSAIYFLFTSVILIQALMSIPLWSSK